MSVTQLPTYTQGFPREFFRNSIYDFAIPQLANVGEQEVTYPEVYFDYDPEGDNSLIGTFGFNRRYYDWFLSSPKFTEICVIVKMFGLVREFSIAALSSIVSLSVLTPNGIILTVFSQILLLLPLISIITWFSVVKRLSLFLVISSMTFNFF